MASKYTSEICFGLLCHCSSLSQHGVNLHGSFLPTPVPAVNKVYVTVWEMTDYVLTSGMLSHFLVSH